MRGIAVALALAGCLGTVTPDSAPVDAPAPREIAKFGCEVRVAIVFVPADEERWSHLPDGFAPYATGESGGPVDSTRRVASVSVLTYACENGTVDGREFGRSLVIAVGTGVVPPEEMRRTEAAHEHGIARAWSDNPVEADALAAWGFGGLGETALATTGPAFEASGRAEGITIAWRGAIGEAEADAPPEGFERHFAVRDREMLGWLDVDLMVVPTGIGESVVDVTSDEPLETTGGPRAAELTVLVRPPPDCGCATIVWRHHARTDG